MHRLSHIFLISWGWRRLGLAFAAGAISALAFAPFGWFAILALTLPALVWLLDGAIEPESGGRRIRPAMFVGWWFFFGFHLAGLWWIGRAFLVDADRFLWLMPLAIVAMPAGLALFGALGTGIAALFWRDGWPRIYALAFAFATTDWLRGNILTGFPWNTWGQAFAETPVLAQLASVTGAYGLGFFVVLIFASPALLAENTRGSRAMPVISGLLLIAIAGFGAARLGAVSPGEYEDIGLRIVQPAVPQEEKWRPEKRAEVFSTLIEMSSQPFSDPYAERPRHIIVWPESAVPFLLTEEPGALSEIAATLRAGDILITGAIRSERRDGERVFYNSIYAIGDDGTILDAYDKVHLVPFGEYVPLESFFELLGITTLVQGAGDFLPGFRNRLLEVDGIPAFSPLVCYEIIFPGAIQTPDGRSAWILNVTNDAWFGETSGPYQHFAQARLRAVEQGIPVVRAANTGISAVIDPYGRIVARLDLQNRGNIDSGLPKYINATFFSYYQKYLFSCFFFISLILLTILRYVNRTRND
ncbi:apolipoprotein N-acyltransferase [Stappia sediminis]|uniref:apolipoprotein N-acyltransferase n=1 Tax=Stappia sediminis TaxID=2692190 RepID=UPI00192665C4|nr:apolipoprotein N-acyltransferase [Stappia sediminis]